MSYKLIVACQYIADVLPSILALMWFCPPEFLYGDTISPYKEGDFLPCYHPLKAFVLGEKDGKRLLKVTSYEVDHLERAGEGFACMRSPPIGRPGDVTEFADDTE